MIFFSLPTLVSRAVSSLACLGPSNALWIPLDVVDLNRLWSLWNKPMLWPTIKTLKFCDLQFDTLGDSICAYGTCVLPMFNSSTKAKTRCVKRVAKKVHWRVDEHRSPLALGPDYMAPIALLLQHWVVNRPPKLAAFSAAPLESAGTQFQSLAPKVYNLKH